MGTIGSTVAQLAATVKEQRHQLNLAALEVIAAKEECDRLRACCDTSGSLMAVLWQLWKAEFARGQKLAEQLKEHQGWSVTDSYGQTEANGCGLPASEIERDS